MERLLTGLADFTIKKILSIKPSHLEATYNKETLCPECGGSEKRIKASFWRKIKSIPQLGFPVTLHIRCHKYHCKQCGRYFNTRMHGVKKWSRSTEPLKNSVFNICRKGYSNRDAASESGISVATVERFYHQMVTHRVSHQNERMCPRYLGIDEHRFSRRVHFTNSFLTIKQIYFDVHLDTVLLSITPFH